MGASKTSQFDQQTIHLAKVARALAHPARITIVNQLLKNKRIAHKEFANLIHLHPVSVHQHMKKLKEAQLVEYHYSPHEYSITLNGKAIHFINSFLPHPFSKT
ncbi:MAG: ArsR family transcriptional regulator [Crocinitomicaceae bacterium]|nr:ArsR family transcriptional regulator [Crocinitomicaceae bacterium]